MNRALLANRLLGGSLFMIAGLIAGCSVVMEASRPAPVRLAQFNKGESRDAVVAKLGQPVSTTTDADGASCDLYSLPLSGYGNLAKAGIAFGEVVADFWTLGIAEAVSTPTEAATRNKKTPVWFCYRKDTLVRVTPKRLEGEDLASSEHAALATGTQASTPAGTVPAAPTQPAPIQPTSKEAVSTSPATAPSASDTK
jgi:hypothetical protein